MFIIFFPPTHTHTTFSCFAVEHKQQKNSHVHQFGAVENGITVTKLMQIFSRQAAMMDALISHFADQTRRRKDGTDVVDNVADDGEFLLPSAQNYFSFAVCENINLC